MKRLLLIGLLLVTALIAGAQSVDVSNPQDPLYRDLEIWEGRGLIPALPNLRPYPLQFVRTQLETVREQGNRVDSELAGRYLTEMFPEPDFGLYWFLNGLFTSEGAGYGIGGTYLTTASWILPWLTLSGYAGAVVTDITEPLLAFPTGERIAHDYTIDYSEISISGRTVSPNLSMGGATAAGSDTFWVQAGLTRNSFGSFDEGPVLSPSAPQAAHFSYTWRRPGLVYQQFLLGLTATSDSGLDDEDNPIEFAPDNTVYPRKYISGQSFQLFPFSWLELSLFETIVFGERLEPAYLLPVVSRLYTSVSIGKMDNIMLGLSATARLPQDLVLDLMFYFDDMHFLNMLAFDFDTKYKMSVQAGLSWYPQITPVLRVVSLDYALVTPYTYSHRTESVTGADEDMDINYVNYTHRGVPLVALEPNSDRLRLRTELQPAKNLDLTLRASFQRHANATPDDYYDAEENPFVGTTDGSVNDNGYDKENGHLFDDTPFLTQDVIEKLLRFGFDISYRYYLDAGYLAAEFGYTFEYGWNRRNKEDYTRMESSGDPDPTYTWRNAPVPIDGNHGAEHYFDIGLVYAY